MADVHVTVWGEGEPAVFVHGVLAWATDDQFGFGGQRPLAEHHRLLLMDRRGYGGSPDIDRSDYRVDAEDIVDLLGDGAHLVGHSYGGVAALLAAGQRPQAVRSLALIQPGCLQLAAGDALVGAALDAAHAAMANGPPDMPPEEYLKLSLEAVGMPAVEPSPERLRAAATSMRERPCWEGGLPTAPVAEAPWPKLVIYGDWEGAPKLYREKAGEPLIITARVTAELIGARQLQVPGYYPQVQYPEMVNAALAELWSLA